MHYAKIYEFAMHSLAICKMIIERHGGKLSASSDTHYGGARFEITLPPISWSSPCQELLWNRALGTNEPLKL
jgi:hypothetical protein